MTKNTSSLNDMVNIKLAEDELLLTEHKHGFDIKLLIEM